MVQEEFRLPFHQYSYQRFAVLVRLNNAGAAVGNANLSKSFFCQFDLE
jgi:hypothetical protein